MAKIAKSYIIYILRHHKKNETVSGISVSLYIQKNPKKLSIIVQFWSERAQESGFSIIFVDLAKKNVKDDLEFCHAPISLINIHQSFLQYQEMP